MGVGGYSKGVEMGLGRGQKPAATLRRHGDSCGSKWLSRPCPSCWCCALSSVGVGVAAKVFVGLNLKPHHLHHPQPLTSNYLVPVPPFSLPVCVRLQAHLALTVDAWRLTYTKYIHVGAPSYMVQPPLLKPPIFALRLSGGRDFLRGSFSWLFSYLLSSSASPTCLFVTEKRNDNTGKKC